MYFTGFIRIALPKFIGESFDQEIEKRNKHKCERACDDHAPDNDRSDFLTAGPAPHLDITLQFPVMESHIIGGETKANTLASSIPEVIPMIRPAKLAASWLGPVRSAQFEAARNKGHLRPDIEPEEAKNLVSGRVC